MNSEEIRWKARYRAARKHGKPFNDPPPTEFCKQLMERHQLEKEAEEEFAPPAAASNQRN
jgi:hypothetical protein